MLDDTASKSTAYYRTTMNTRYGAYWHTFHPNKRPREPLRSLDAAGTGSDVGDNGVFFWGQIPFEITRAHLAPVGLLNFTESTVAVGEGDLHDSPAMFEGVADMHLNLAIRTISGVVSELGDVDCNPPMVDLAEVEKILLPSVHQIPVALA